MADFAKAQLMKYGWTEGKGLGKNENGITTPLKPTLKFDTAGIGHKYLEDNQWWEVEFNKAANSITVDSQDSGISISVSKEDDFKQVKSKKKKSKPNPQYGNFLKTSTLCNGTLVPEQDSSSTEVKNLENGIVHIALTDEELFKACGGRTAHKGARHGLRLNGKLERIARQEEKLLSAITSSTTSEPSILCKGSNQKHKPKKRSRDSDEDDGEVDNNANTIEPLLASPQEEIEPSKLSKGTRKKHRRKMNQLIHQLDVLCTVNGDDVEAEKHTIDDVKVKKNKRSKQRKNKDSAGDDTSRSSVKEQDDGEIKHKEAKGQQSPDTADTSESTDTYSKREAKRLNRKIEKKKAAHKNKKAKIKMEQVIQSLQSVHFDTENSSKGPIAQKKIETIVNDLMAVQIAEDVTEKVKDKSLKKKNKKSKKMKFLKENQKKGSLIPCS